VGPDGERKALPKGGRGQMKERKSAPFRASREKDKSPRGFYCKKILTAFDALRLRGHLDVPSHYGGRKGRTSYPALRSTSREKRRS